MQSLMNLKIKFRESFRPFAPSVLNDVAEEYFEIDVPSPYMLLVAPVRRNRRNKLIEEEHLFGMEKLKIPRSDIPAVTHVDYSARIQTVDGKYNPKYYNLISRFMNKTDYGVIINTSFNVRGEPIVCSPYDAYLCFMRTEMDMLALGNCLLLKEEQPELTEEKDWTKVFTLD